VILDIVIIRLSLAMLIEIGNVDQTLGGQQSCGLQVINPLTAVTSLGVKLFHVLNTTINIKDIF
jgi:hypothetical protein